jgi:hypothetical protein
VSQGEFAVALEAELRRRGLAFNRADVLEFAADVGPLIEDKPDPAWWVDRFVHAVHGKT